MKRSILKKALNAPWKRVLYEIYNTAPETYYETKENNEKKENETLRLSSSEHHLANK